MTGKFGRLDVLCANAAFIIPWHDVLGANDDEWHRCIEAALKGTDNYTREALP